MVRLPEPFTSTPLPARLISWLESLASAIRKSAEREENDDGSPLAGPTVASLVRLRRLPVICRLGIFPSRIIPRPLPVTPSRGSLDLRTKPFILAVPSKVPVIRPLVWGKESRNSAILTLLTFASTPYARFAPPKSRERFPAALPL